MIRFEARGLRRGRDDRSAGAPQRAQRRALHAAARPSRRQLRAAGDRDHRRGLGVLRGCRSRHPLRATEASAARSGRHVPARVRGGARRDRRPSRAGDRGDQRSGDRRGDAARGRVRPARRGARRGFAIPGGRLGVHLSPRNIWRLAELVGQGAARDFLLAGRVRRRRRGAAARARAVRRRRRARRRARARGRDRGVGAAHGARSQAGAQPRRRGAVARPTTPAPRSPRSRAAAFASDDLQEGMAAFAEKRTPNFRATSGCSPPRQ